MLLRAQRYPDDQWVQATKLVDWGLALPKGTPPVGHLVVSARAADPTTAAPGSGAASSGASTSGASSSGGGHSKGSGPNNGLRVLLLVALFGALFVLAQRLRRPRPSGGGTNSPGPRRPPDAG